MSGGISLLCTLLPVSERERESDREIRENAASHWAHLCTHTQTEEDGAICCRVEKTLHILGQRLGRIDMHATHRHHGVHSGTCRRQWCVTVEQHHRDLSFHLPDLWHLSCKYPLTVSGNSQGEARFSRRLTQHLAEVLLRDGIHLGEVVEVPIKILVQRFVGVLHALHEGHAIGEGHKTVWHKGPGRDQTHHLTHVILVAQRAGRHNGHPVLVRQGEEGLLVELLGQQQIKDALRVLRMDQCLHLGLLQCMLRGLEANNLQHLQEVVVLHARQIEQMLHAEVQLDWGADRLLYILYI